jgi:hypothetical protein
MPESFPSFLRPLLYDYFQRLHLCIAQADRPHDSYVP